MKQNKSCGIVTFYKSNNYGGILQSYALKTILTRYCKPYFVKHENTKIASWHSIRPPMPTNRRKLKEFIIKTLCYFPALKKKQRFDLFRERYLPEGSNQDGDFYITGSDQVWNFECNDFNEDYFLQFAEKSKRNAYSASFGFNEIPIEYRDFYHRLLTDFNKMSVREKTGSIILKDLIDRDVPVTLDPTLLLAKEEWATIFTKTIKQKPYILVYTFAITKTIVEFVDKLAEERGLQTIVLLPPKGFWQKSAFKTAKYLSNVSPEDWVQYFYNADYIVTNSFHGIAFSINFQKNFSAELRPEPSKINSRIIDILSLFGLNDRYIDQPHATDCIDYTYAQEVLSQQRVKSIAYLESIINDYQ